MTLNRNYGYFSVVGGIADNALALGEVLFFTNKKINKSKNKILLSDLLAAVAYDKVKYEEQKN